MRDAHAINEIFNYDGMEIEHSYEKNILEKSKNIDKIPNINVKEKIKELEELKVLIDERNLNKCQISVKYYYEKLQK